MQIVVALKNIPAGPLNPDQAESSPAIILFDKDIPDNLVHKNAFYIAIDHSIEHIKGKLVDNGASTNICPPSTLNFPGYPHFQGDTSDGTTTAYDGSVQEIMGSTTMMLRIGSNIREVNFMIVECEALFMLLLGCP